MREIDPEEETKGEKEKLSQNQKHWSTDYLAYVYVFHAFRRYYLHQII